MAALTYWDPVSGTFKELFYSDKGEKGDPGPVGPSGSGGPLDGLSDVSAPADTVAGKVLGTTATGVWGPVDFTDPGNTFVDVSGDVMTGSLEILSGGLQVRDGGIISEGPTRSIFEAPIEAQGGVWLDNLPVNSIDATNKQYVDSRIWTGTQAAYDAIPSKDPTVLYVVVG